MSHLSHGTWGERYGWKDEVVGDDGTQRQTHALLHGMRALSRHPPIGLGGAATGIAHPGRLHLPGHGGLARRARFPGSAGASIGWDAHSLVIALLVAALALLPSGLRAAGNEAWRYVARPVTMALVGAGFTFSASVIAFVELSDTEQLPPVRGLRIEDEPER